MGNTALCAQRQGSVSQTSSYWMAASDGLTGSQYLLPQEMFPLLASTAVIVLMRFANLEIFWTLRNFQVWVSRRDFP